MFLLKILRFQSLFYLKRHFIGMLGLWQFFGLPFLFILELFVNVSGKSDCETYYVCLLLKRYHSDKSSDNHGQDDTLLPQCALFLSDS